MGRDYTIFATREGHVKFEYVSKDRKQVSVVPEGE
jgi:ribosomal protein L27